MHPTHKRMIQKMADDQKGKRKPVCDPWFLYILCCQDGTYYTGVTKDLERRLKMHNDGRASRYTRARRPVTLIYQEDCRGRAQALMRECAVKALSRKQKDQLVLNGSKSLKKKRRRNHG